MIIKDAQGNVYDTSSDNPPVNDPDFSWVDQGDLYPQEIAAYRLTKGVKRTPEAVYDDRYKYFGPENPERPSYMVEPSLLEAQGGMELPPGVAQDATGALTYKDTGDLVPIAKRPALLPFTATPEGFKFVTPKLLDLVGNVMAPLAAGKVPLQAGEAILGSGAVRTMQKAIQPAKESLSDVANANFKYSKILGNQEIPISDLKGGVRTSSAEDMKRVDNLASEINSENGYIERLIVDDAGNIVEGQHRYEALKKLGYKKVPVTVIKDLERGYDVDKMKEAVKASGIKSSDQINQIIKNNLELLHDEGGDISKVISEYDLKPYDIAALKAINTNKTAEPFYSALERAVQNAKVQKASGESWLGYLKNQPGVKSEELSTVLGELPEGQISKAQLEDIVKNNKVELRETVKSGDLNNRDKITEMITRDVKREHPNWNIDGDRFISEVETRVDNHLKNYPVQTNPTKYHSYQLPGGENYKEMLLQLPVKTSDKTKEGLELTRRMNEGEFNSLNDAERKALFKKRDDLLKEGRLEDGTPYKSSHWDEPNILAHIRMNDRNIEGKKVLHLEEIQSDWHQAGRKHGYKINDKQKAELESIDEKLMNGLEEKDIGNPDVNAVLKTAVDKKVISQEEATKYKEYSKGENSKIPDAPFKKNWDELALKRMVRHAAENGYEGISWTPGEAQAARYDLSKQIDHVKYYGDKKLVAIDKNNKVILNEDVSPDKLQDYIGKEAAEKLMKLEPKKVNDAFTRMENSDVRHLKNADLKIGGEGMKAFYDKMLVDRANALGKKYGAKVEGKTIPSDKEYYIAEHTFGGENKGKKVWDIRWKEKDGNERFNASYPTKAEAEKRLAELQADKGTPIHYLPLTPALRQKAMQEGFPLFSSTPTLVPVDTKPEFKKKYKLTKVDHDPFR